ncbi:MAG: DUF2281 domain-containing protein [Candidatus Aminicenantes bacterium]|nr:DUF2281 domain-containing protein [Candidatus Aminicenantes bacterium]
MRPNENVLRKFEIMRALSYVPDERLREVDNFIKFILQQSNIRVKTKKDEPDTLAGIWKGKGFEKIADIDKEIGSLREELGNKILERHK